jgi:hypothetical protein
MILDKDTEMWMEDAEAASRGEYICIEAVNRALESVPKNVKKIRQMYPEIGEKIARLTAELLVKEARYDLEKRREEEEKGEKYVTRIYTPAAEDSLGLANLITGEYIRKMPRIVYVKKAA